MTSEDNNSNLKKLSVAGVLLIIFPVVFGFNNSAVAFYRMGYSSIVWYLIGALTFFLPLMLIIAEYAFSFKNDEGGIQTWMSKSKGSYFGFVVTFIFYFAQIFWMVNFSTTRIWIPMSYGIFGSDMTKSLNILGLNPTQSIGLCSIAFIILVTFIITRDFSKFSNISKLGGIACMSINIILILSAILIAVLQLLKNEPVFQEPIHGIKTFFIPPNENLANPIAIFSFMSFATFAYAGSETIGSLASKTKTKKTFSKGILYATIVIAIGYSLAIFLWGFVQNSQNLNQNKYINFGNVLYNLMADLGMKIGNTLGFPDSISSNVISVLFARAAGIALLLTTIGAFFAVMYAPIQAVIKGAPDGLFPRFLNKKNKFGANYNALWLQALIVCSIIGIISFGGKSAKAFYDLIVLMANVAQTCPYVFIFLAFPAFRNNPELDHSFTIFKSKFSVYTASIAGFLTVLIADVLTILHPMIDKEEINGTTKTIFMAIGPILFILIGILIYKNYEKKIKSNKV